MFTIFLRLIFVILITIILIVTLFAALITGILNDSLIVTAISFTIVNICGVTNIILNGSADFKSLKKLIDHLAISDPLTSPIVTLIRYVQVRNSHFFDMLTLYTLPFLLISGIGFFIGDDNTKTLIIKGVLNGAIFGAINGIIVDVTRHLIVLNNPEIHDLSIRRLFFSFLFSIPIPIIGSVRSSIIGINIAGTVILTNYFI